MHNQPPNGQSGKRIPRLSEINERKRTIQMTKTNGRYQRNRAAGKEKEKEKVKKYLVSFSRPSASRRFQRAFCTFCTGSPRIYGMINLTQKKSLWKRALLIEQSLIVLGTLYKSLQTNAVNPEANYKCIFKQNEGVQRRR